MFNKDIERLIQEHSFPLYLYDKEMLMKKVDIVRENFKGWTILYSMKANPFESILELFRENGLLIDAASAGEVKRANLLGYSTSDIYYSSPGKSEEDISDALEQCTIIADSVNEINTINKVALRQNKSIEIGIRLNITNSLIDGNAFEVMGGVESKFGVSMETLRVNIDQIKSLTNVKVTGIHIYFGSQVLDERVLANNFMLIARAAREVIHWLDLKFVNFGGGFGVPYQKTEKALDFCKFSEYLEREDIDWLIRNNISCNLELGRFLVAECGTYVTKVIDIKQSVQKKYAVLYGGMNSFFRPIFTNEYHPIYKFHKSGGSSCELKEKITIVGNLCTPLDQYYDEIELEPLQAGDIIVFENAGAYGYSMSMLEFISYRKPKQILIGEE